MIHQSVRRMYHVVFIQARVIGSVDDLHLQHTPHRQSSDHEVEPSAVLGLMRLSSVIGSCPYAIIIRLVCLFDSKQISIVEVGGEYNTIRECEYIMCRCRSYN